MKKKDLVGFLTPFSDEVDIEIVPEYAFENGKAKIINKIPPYLPMNESEKYAFEHPVSDTAARVLCLYIKKINQVLQRRKL